MENKTINETFLKNESITLIIYTLKRKSDENN